MKNLHFALRGMFIKTVYAAAVLTALAAVAALFVFYSCSLGGNDPEGQAVIEDTTEDESGAAKNPPITKPEDKEPQDKGPSDGDQSDEDSSDEDPSDEYPPDDDQYEEDDDPFSPNMPSILINEVYTEYEKATSKIEFIEFKIFSSGNLEGLKVFITGNTATPFVYDFFPVQVRKGEYIVLHLRVLEDACADERGTDLNESGGKSSLPNVRDFWVYQDKELLRKTDAVYIMDKDDNILDAVMFAENTIPKNSVTPFFAAAEYLFSKGAEGGEFPRAWMSPNGTLPGHEDAVKSSLLGSSLTRSISRDESTPDTNTAADWYVTATGGYSPGKKNSTDRM